MILRSTAWPQAARIAGYTTALSALRELLGVLEADSGEPVEGESDLALHNRVRDWLNQVYARGQDDREWRFWPSQAAAIRALVLEGASPQGARAAGRRAYAAARG